MSKPIEYFIGVQGAVRDAVLAASDSNGRIVGTARVGPLALRISTDLRSDMLRALTEFGSNLSPPIDPQQLKGQTRGVCVAMSGVFQPSEFYAVERVFDDLGYDHPITRIVCEDVWADLAAAGFDSGVCDSPRLSDSGGGNFLRR